MKLFDTHAHLTADRFDADRSEVIQRLTDAGVEYLLLVGEASEKDQMIYTLAEAHKNFYAATGVHPHEAEHWSEEIREYILRCMEHPKSVALGEIGLDYYYDFSPRDVQKRVFEEQLEMAYQLKKPVILHIRDAHGDATEILTARAREGRMPEGVMHCYTGSWESAKQYLNMGLYISFTGAVTFKNAPKLAEVARNLPADRILVETDCPYMAPVPMRGKRNEPAFVTYTAAKIAELRCEDPEAFSLQALENGRRLFKI